MTTTWQHDAKTRRWAAEAPNGLAVWVLQRGRRYECGIGRAARSMNCGAFATVEAAQTHALARATGQAR